MAITVDNELSRQQVENNTHTYCYLYEPLRVLIADTNTAATKIYIDIKLYSRISGTLKETLNKYASFDIISGQSISVDLMNLARQHYDANVYNFAHLLGITNENSGVFRTLNDNCDVQLHVVAGNWTEGKDAVVCKHTYEFRIYSDISDQEQDIGRIFAKSIIIGGRDLQNFTDPRVHQDQPLTEADLYGVSLLNRWKEYPIITNALATITDSEQSVNPIIEIADSYGPKVVEGYVVWKSRLGGWMSWGFDIVTRKNSKKYIGDIKTGMFESTTSHFGQPYVPVNYTGIEMSYSITLKALGLSKDELKAVSGIEFSPAVYYFRRGGLGFLELMRLTSSSIPLSSISEGGDFTITLQSISTTEHKTR